MDSCTTLKLVLDFTKADTEDDGDGGEAHDTTLHIFSTLLTNIARDSAGISGEV
jgi:hypothetical protein